MMIRSVILMCLGFSIGVSSTFASDLEKLQESLKKWEQVKKRCNGNYSYKVHWSSFAGFGHETQIIVRANKVAERRFRAFNNQPVQPGKPAAKGNNWVEKGESIGKHKHGAAPRTLDELYAQAAKIVQGEVSEFERLSLQFDKQGLLRTCYTVDTRIADDAPTKGVIISGLVIGDNKNDKNENPGKVYKSPNGKVYPASWGAPPLRQTRDLRPLPAGYGLGSSTLAQWIQKNLDNDAKQK